MRSWNATHAAHAQIHHSGPAARISQSTSAASGRPSAAATAMPFARSASHSARVIRLKPNFASMTNVLHVREGQRDDAGDHRDRDDQREIAREPPEAEDRRSSDEQGKPAARP